MRKLITTLLIITAFSFLIAENYTLPYLIDSALKNSYYSFQMETQNAISRSRNREQWQNLLPEATISLSKYKDYDNDEYDYGRLGISKTFRLNDPVFFNILDSEINTEISELELMQQRKETAVRVINLYLNVMIAQSEAEIYKSNLELQRSITKQVEILKETGGASLLDLQQSRITEMDYTISLKRAKTALKSARNSLFTYIRLPDNDIPLDVFDFKLDSLHIEPMQNYENMIQKKQIKQAKLNLLQKATGFLPALTLSYDLSHYKYNDIFNTDDYQRNTNQISLNLSYDFCDIGIDRENYVQSRLNLLLLKEINESYNLTLTKDVENLKNELANLMETNALYQNKLSLAEENLKLAQTQYELGTIGLLDLDKAVISLSDARLESIRSSYEYITKRESLNQLLSLPILEKW